MGNECSGIQIWWCKVKVVDAHSSWLLDKMSKFNVLFLNIFYLTPYLTRWHWLGQTDKVTESTERFIGGNCWPLCLEQPTAESRRGEQRNMGEVIVDSSFIQATEHRPHLKVVEADEIPLIDLSPLNLHQDHPNDQQDLNHLVAQIGEACRDWGFFGVINHGVPSHLQQRVEAAAKKFFDCSLEEKLKVRRDELNNPLGFYESEHTKNVRDWKEVFDFTVEDPTFLPASHLEGDEELQELRNQWPHNPSEFRQVCEEYTKAVEKLAFELLQLISLSLGLPAKSLNSFFKDQTSFVRVNHYPPCPTPQLALGVGRHKDAGALTVLAQDDVGGLEVKRKTDGEWVRVKPIPDCFIINVGDVIQVWSNDKYESVEHRVMTNRIRERFSIPFFFNPGHHVNVKPLEEVLHEDNHPPKYREYNWGKFFKTRKLSDFKKLDVENIQIYHFRISGH